MSREIRPTYAGSKSAMERLKRGIIHARALVRECLAETERSAQGSRSSVPARHQAVVFKCSVNRGLRAPAPTRRQATSSQRAPSVTGFSNEMKRSLAMEALRLGSRSRTFSKSARASTSFHTAAWAFARL
ncbi:Cyclin-dependent kinase 2-associated protein 2 [Liparis tanakae]|uniref:Cyclin-dependent kinase 2-associated protein 2 n=1 Tax=Liparis tanakae TaxID=230148 RepID=A0A4Z2EHI3_9TELE|nr:Cyclin-dependent kinase 2-associated protein 2 [Liparis tanakae]